MKKIVLTRIDDRLIHGQVVTAWLKHIKADAILIVDNDLAKNTMMARIYKAAAPSDIELLIKTIEDSITFLKGAAKPQSIFILTKTPEIIETLQSAEIVIREIILGGMGANKNRRQLIKNVFASDEERAAMSRMLAGGTRISYQLVPDDRQIKVEKELLEKSK